MRRSSILLLALIILTCPAQAKSSDTELSLDELLLSPVDAVFNLGSITVGGGRIPLARGQDTLHNTPFSTSLLRASDLKDAPQLSLPESLSRQEGVTYSDDLGQGSSARVDLRGFGGEAKQALVTWDGLRAVEPFDNSTTWSLYPKEYLREVEVRKGASSPVYGEGALSGVIELRTKEPTQDWHVAGESAWGSYGSQRYFAEVSGTHSSGIGLYVAGRYSETEGYRQNSFHDGTSALIKAEAAVHELLSAHNSFYFADQETGIPGPLSPTEADADRRQKDPDGQFGDQFTDGLIQDSVRLDYWAEPINAEISNLAGYRSREQDSVQSFGGFFPGTSFNDIGTETFSDVVQASKEWTTGPHRQKSLLGFEWAIDDIHNPFTFDDKTFGPFSSERSIDRRMLGYFAQHRAEFWERSIIEFGMRYDAIDWQIYDLLSPNLEKKKKATHLSPSFGLEWKIVPDVALFFNLSEAFKVPDANTLIFETPNIFTPNPNIDSSVARHAEIGTRWKQGEKGYLKLAAYRIETKKEILFNDITNTNENFDTQRQGIEISQDWTINKHVGVNVRYTYADSEFDNGVFDGNKIPLVPESSWSAGTTVMPDEHWRLNGYASGVKDQYALNDFNNIFPVENYWTVGAQVSYRQGSWELFIRGDNLLGEEFSSFTTSDGVSLLNLNPAPEQNFEFGVKIAL